MTRALTSKDKVRILEHAKDCATQGLRVISLGFSRDLDSLTFVGLLAMADPPRPGVDEAVRALLNCQVKVMMITGDSKDTATCIAHECGIPVDDPMVNVVDGNILDGKSIADIEPIVNDISVICRATPRHKLTMIEALQRAGHVVAMIGDGVNDSPSVGSLLDNITYNLFLQYVS